MMQIIKTKIQDCLIIESKCITDNRGFFTKITEINSLKTLHMEIKEVYYSRSKKDVIRGMHFQTKPYDMKKIIACTMGEILDVFIDIRPNSPTYGLTDSVIISDKLGKMIFIPEGIAHGFKVLSDEADVLYLQSKPFSQEHDSVIAYNSFGFDWSVKNPILSTKDNNAVKLQDFLGNV